MLEDYFREMPYIVVVLNFSLNRYWPLLETGLLASHRDTVLIRGIRC